MLDNALSNSCLLHNTLIFVIIQLNKSEVSKTHIMSDQK